MDFEATLFYKLFFIRDALCQVTASNLQQKSIRNVLKRINWLLFLISLSFELLNSFPAWRGCVWGWRRSCHRIKMLFEMIFIFAFSNALKCLIFFWFHWFFCTCHRTFYLSFPLSSTLDVMYLSMLKHRKKFTINLCLSMCFFFAPSHRLLHICTILMSITSFFGFFSPTPAIACSKILSCIERTPGWDSIKNFVQRENFADCTELSTYVTII